ncbi:MAG: thermonuclease family protein [Rhodospirillales bacterium]|nr:thermonuclease family protein [Rhodospirillales bacterium]
MSEITVTEVIVTHVEPGETLSEIAARYEVSLDALLRWNRIDNPDLVLVGQRIVVHTAGDASETFAFESATSQAAPRPDVVDAVALGAIGVAVVLILLLAAAGRSPATRTSRTPPPPRRSPAIPVSRSPPPSRRHLGALVGKAYVTDGDGIRVSGQEVRFAGLDAPEYDQVAKHRDGYWFGHGKRVKSALIQKIGGEQVYVTVESYDKFGRAVGTIACNGMDVGEWLVREGHAIAAYSDRYKQVEQEARRARRGMWGYAVNIDPRRWRHRKT